jgi:hypothetical protein
MVIKMKKITTICALATALAFTACEGSGNRGDYEFQGKLGNSTIHAYEEPGLFSDDFYVKEELTKTEGDNQRMVLVTYKDESGDDLEVDEVCIEDPLGSEETCYEGDGSLGKSILSKAQTRFKSILSCILAYNSKKAVTVFDDTDLEFKCDYGK